MFGIRIVELRKSKKLTQSQVAKAIGISRSALSLYELEKREPDIQTLNKLATFFDVPVGYLSGKESQITPTSFETNPKKESSGFFFFFFDCWDECLSKIKNRLQELDISETDFCMDLNINLNEEVSINDLKSIASKLELSTDYLLGMTETKNASPEDVLFAQSLSSREKDIIENFRLLNKDNQDIIVGELKKSLKEQRRESVAADSTPPEKTGTDGLGK